MSLATVRIATFNLEDLDDRPERGAGLEARIALLRPQLERVRADILCLQEVNGQRRQSGEGRELLALDRLLAETPYASFHRVHSVAGETGELADKHNLVVLSRWPIDAFEQLRHDLVDAPGYRPATALPPEAEPRAVEWDRPILHAVVATAAGERLHVINLHLRAPLAAPVAGQKLGPFCWKSASGWAEGFYIAMLKRSGQALETRLLIDRIFEREPEARIVVCGDFNAEEREVPLRIVCADVADTGNGRLAGRALVPLERTLPEARRFSVIHCGQRLMLDHMLVSRSLLAHYRSLEVHNEALGDGLVAYATVDGPVESYHAPVVASFEMAAR